MQRLTIAEAEYILKIVETALSDQSPHPHHSAALLRGYDIVLIDAAIKLRIAREYLAIAGHPNFAAEWASACKVYDPLLVTLSHCFVRDYQVGTACADWAFPLLNPDTMELLEPFASLEDVSSFARYCESLDPDGSNFWTNVYSRVHLRHDHRSPQGNEGRRRPG